MNVEVNQNKLSQTLSGNPDRIVLGGGADVIVLGILVMLGVWIAFAAGIMMFVMGADFQQAARMVAGTIPAVYLLVGWKSRLTLDLGARTFLHEYGLPPFMRRRRGRLDEFDHFALTKGAMRTQFSSGSTYTTWKLILTPKEGAQASLPGNAAVFATAPIVLMFSWGEDDAGIIVLSQKLSQTCALPLRNESQQLTPPAG